MKKVTAIAHTNIALIKYWGKADEELRIPYTDSLSLTLNDFYTETSVSRSLKDEFWLDNKLQDLTHSKRVFKFLDYFRKKFNINEHFLIKSFNHVPNSAGLASSASAFAALAAALVKVMDFNLSFEDISKLARVGSGSASRSIMGGFVQWHAGIDDETSFAEQFNDGQNIDISLISVILNDTPKKISSTEGMLKTKLTSPFYQIWPKVVEKDLTDIKKAISNNDFNKIGEIAEHNAMEMHALTFSSNPSFTYFEPETLELINYIHELRASGIPVYFTIDAGPNVKVICQKETVNLVNDKLTTKFNNIKTIVTKPGPGIQYKTI